MATLAKADQAQRVPQEAGPHSAGERRQDRQSLRLGRSACQRLTVPARTFLPWAVLPMAATSAALVLCRGLADLRAAAVPSVPRLRAANYHARCGPPAAADGEESGAGAEGDEEEDSQLIVPAASGSGSDSSGGDSNINTSRSGSPSEDGYVKIVRNTLGVPMSESEFLSAPVVVTDKKETHEKTTADVEEEEGQDGGNDNLTAEC